MKIKRILGLLLVLAALTSVFASCEKAAEPDTLIADAEAALKTAPYTVISTVEYTSPDEDMSAIIASFSIPAIRVGVDKDKFNAYMYIKSGEKDKQMTYALKSVRFDPYYRILEKYYRDGEKIETLATDFGVDASTIARKKKELCIKLYHAII